MNRKETRGALFPNCPIRNVLSRIGDKWSMLVLFILEDNNSQRFKELQRNEGDGFILREAFPEIPPRVEYSLTDRGRSLLPLIDNLLVWSTENMNDIMESRQHYMLK